MNESNSISLTAQGADPFFLMAGPNVIQSEEHIFKMCRQIKHVTDRCVQINCHVTHRMK